MALSNAERQARYKAKLKAAASAPPNIRELVLAFLRAHPEECFDGFSAEESAATHLETLVTFRRQVDYWGELYPDADLSTLKAVFAGVELPPLKRRRGRSGQA